MINEEQQTYMKHPRWDESHDQPINQESRDVGAGREYNKEEIIAKIRWKMNI